MNETEEYLESAADEYTVKNDYTGRCSMEIKQKTSNYEKMKDEMAGAFLQYDQERMIRKFGLEHDGAFLYLRCLNRHYRINRQNGQVSWSEDAFRTEEKADYNEAMTIYDVLCCSGEDCHPAHEWVNVKSLSSVRGGTLEKGSDFFHNAGKYFEGKADALSRACEKLGGKRLEKGDAAYELPLFPFLSTIVRFWDSDEEFPASLQILVDKNILDYMHYETLMFAISHLLNRLKEEM